jgi:hypothetical protein
MVRSRARVALSTGLWLCCDAASELNFSMSIAQDCAGEEMLAKRATKMAVFYR